MELNKFDKKYMNGAWTPHLKLKPGGRRKGITWEQSFKLAELSKHFEFNCDFDENGICKARRKGITKKNIKTFHKVYNKGSKYWRKYLDNYNTPYEDRVYQGVMCCCAGCHTTVGHHYTLPKQKNLRRKIAKYFNDRTGFWRPGKGCILPRKYRSSVCIGYVCHSMSIFPHKKLLLNVIYLMRSSTVDYSKAEELIEELKQKNLKPKEKR